MALDMAKFLTRFIEEARDNVNKLNQGLVKLEKNPDDAETVNAVFRSAHTIKGSARLMKLTGISEVAHRLEDVLAALREGKIGHSIQLNDVLFKGIDCIAELVEKTASGKVPEGDTSALCEALSQAASGTLALNSQRRGGKKNEGETTAAAAQNIAPAVNAVFEVKSGKAAATGGGSADLSSRPSGGTDPAATETIRVDARKLDVLIRLMGEIVSTQNRLKHRLTEVKEAQRLAKRKSALLSTRRNEGTVDLFQQDIIKTSLALSGKINKLAADMRDDATIQELLTTELQEKALMMRMVPLGQVFDPLHRMVRDLARSQEKNVDFIVEGADIGIDKKMMEKIGAPLIHMLRNAVDHGIESAEERRKAGKPEQGRITLSACYDAGSVVMELRDDGSGIAVDKVRERALLKKLFSKEELAVMTESDLVDLIFLPGFSTSSLITDVSGRGVGMDVVRKNFIEELKGAVSVETKTGAGVCFTIRLPMTLAVMRVLLVNTVNRTFAVTTQYVAEIVRVSASEVISVLGRKAIRLREELIPVQHLADLVEHTSGNPQRKNEILILIAKAGNEKLGLIVDSLIDEEDMVIKSLPYHLTKLPLVAGITISGKNEVICILNIPGMIAVAQSLTETRREGQAAEPADSTVRILVVDDSINTRDIEKNILEAYGYEVDLAGDGIEAIEKTRNARYDLIVTDIEMPRLDGFSLTERLRSDETYKHTPIIIVTSREKEEDKKRGIMVGANAYIVKGAFDQTNLLETVQNLVG